MPTYEYICAKCDHQFEVTQSITEKPLTICPRESCGQKKWGKGKVKRAIGTGGGLIFKGSGFYITDYRSDKYKEAAKKDSAPAAAPSGDSKASGDSKPAKTESKPAKPAPAKS
jgi:putative FmdB family regulatory protein